MKLPLIASLLLFSMILLPQAGSEVHFHFTEIGQTIKEDFNSFRGTRESLPANIHLDWDTDITQQPYGGVGDYRTSDPSSSYGGFVAYTADGENFSFGIRERQPHDLRDARVYLPIFNGTGQSVRYIRVSYDIEVWFNGERDNRIRLKYDDTFGGGRFEYDVVSTTNPMGGGQRSGVKMNGSLPENRVPVEVVIDLQEYLDPRDVPFGSLPSGQSAWLRWQFSNADVNTGGGSAERSGLAINNLKVTLLESP